MLDKRDIAEILGAICDGFDVSQTEQEVAIAALKGSVLTSDAGECLYYLDLDTALLDNVDTDECIWTVDADGLLRLPDGRIMLDLNDENAAFQEGFLMLKLICESNSMRRIQEKWMNHSDPQRPVMWQRAFKRVVEPLLSWSNCQSSHA